MVTKLKSKTVRGAAWTIAGYGTSQLIRFGGNIILTRLLAPQYFGFMAVVNTLLIGIELLSDLGIGQSIIQHKRGDDPEFLNTAWTLQIVRGVGIWLLCLAMTIPVTNYYGDRRLLWMFPLMGLGSVILGFMSTAYVQLNRHMDLRKVVSFDITIQTLSLGILIILAFFFKNIWIFAVAGLAGNILRTLGSHWMIAGKLPRFAWEKDALRDLISFGKWMFVATALMFLAEQSDKLIVGKLLSLEVLGVYSIAATLANMPREVIKSLSYRVIFPTISAQTDLSRSELRTKIAQKRQKALLAVAIGLALLVNIGDGVIAFLYDQRYTAAIWMMPILCSGIWFSVLFYTLSPALVALGQPVYVAQSNLMRFLMISVGLPLAYTQWGVVGAIATIALSDFPLYLAINYGLWREKLSCFRQDMQSTLVYIAALLIFMLIRVVCGLGTPFDSIPPLS
ncbi:oligosaccharide flippase family protein [Calothrix sp. NIES-3974]|uniref:oligosaccharide flippase family protein n=1 Tax=Calothrix sp. NIES-3974 TaxID=2005462 RepID=UPI000B6197CD|nr:oligosaccharide flippase family protein [Calothrix sp. NIES-3974]BAZ03437.1 hypothetical protein NIES3974_00630 [Calothrix sp. NIES-3974]